MKKIKKILLYSLPISFIIFVSIVLFQNIPWNHKYAYIENNNSGSGYIITFFSDRIWHPSNFLSAIFPKTYIQQEKITFPKNSGTVLWKNIPHKMWHYAYTGSAKFNDNTLILDLYVDNTDDNIIDPLWLNGKYILKNEKYVDYRMNDIERKELSNKNPTSYVFNVWIKKLQENIYSWFKDITEQEKMNFIKDDWYKLHFSLETPEDTIFAKDLLLSPVNNNDFYLHSHRFYKSNTYFYENKPLLVSWWYHLHLESVEKNKTKVTVIPIKFELLLGTEDSFPKWKKISFDIPSTSIEEYKILLYIGNRLWTEWMPELKLK